jgi:hypothetical protein
MTSGILGQPHYWSVVAATASVTAEVSPGIDGLGARNDLSIAAASTHPMNTRIATVLLIATGSLCGCATEPVEVPLEQSPPDTNVYFYPSQGRSVSAAQQGRDRYECNTWADQQTGFDPSAPDLPPHRRMQIVGQPTPDSVVVGAGAVTGAAVGAGVSLPWQAERDQEFDRLKAQTDLSEAQTALVERKASDFRRALGACLEARGYSVR